MMAETIDLEVKPEPIEEQPHQQGHRVWPALTGPLDPNEKVLLLIERNEQAPDSKGFRRYQTLFVSRGDKVVKFMADMGPESLFAAGPLNIPGGDPANPQADWSMNVTEIQVEADYLREYLLEKEYQEGKKQAPDLIQKYADEIDQGDMTRKGKRWYPL